MGKIKGLPKIGQAKKTKDSIKFKKSTPSSHSKPSKDQSTSKYFEFDTKFVPLNATNVNLIKQYFESISTELFDHLAKSSKYVLYQFEGKGYDIFLIPTEMSPLVKKLSRSFPIHHAGIHLGYMRRRKTRTGFERAFFLSYEGGEFLLNYIKTEFTKVEKEIQKINLDKKGEQAFLYGRNIEFSEIISDTSNLSKKHIIFVLDKLNNYLGLALLIVKQAGVNQPSRESGYKYSDRNSRSHNFTLSLLNLIDAGYYLRKGG